MAPCPWLSRKIKKRAKKDETDGSAAGTPNLDSLPDLVLVNIFSKMSLQERTRMEAVNRRFADLSILSWSTLSTFTWLQSPVPGDVDGETDREEDARLYASTPHILDKPAAFLVQLLPRMRTISTLNLILKRRSPGLGIGVEDAVFNAIADFCPHLKNVVVKGWDKDIRCMEPFSRCVKIERFRFRLTTVQVG